MIRLVGRLVRASGYLALTATILVGIPWASIRWVGWPLPTSVPDGPTLQDWFDHPFTPTRIWAGLSIIGWFLWAALVISVVLELLSLFGHVRVPRLRLVTPMQGLAGGLVGATATVLTAPAAHAAPAPATTAPAVPERDLTAAPTGATAVPLALPAGSRPTSAATVYEVAHGDWMSAIAARFLGDPDAYSRIAQMNPQLKARDARFPNHIEPGWHVRLPTDAHDRGIRLHAAGTITVAPGNAETPLRPPAAQPLPPGPTTSADTPTPTPAVPDNADSSSILDDDRPDVVIGQHRAGAMTGAGLVAAMLLALLTTERRRQRGYLIPGQDTPLPRDSRAERELRIAQLPADVERMHAALRDLSRALSTREERPDIVGVRLVGRDVQVLLAEPDENPPRPWLDEGTQWALPGYVEPEETAYPATLLPLLVTVGSRAGRHLHVDLHRLGTLSITGHPDRARDLLRHMVCDLACAPWADDVSVLLAGFGDEGEALVDIQPARVRPLPTVTEAIATVRTELRDRTEAAAPTSPLVLAVANPTAEMRTELDALHQDLVVAGQCGIAVVVSTGDSAPIASPVLAVDEDGAVKVDVPGLRLTTDAASVPVDMVEPLAQVLRAARLALPTAPPVTSTVDADATQAPAPVDPSVGVLALFDADAMPPAPARGSIAPATVVTTTASTQVDADDADPMLDADIAAWLDADPTRPRVAILGPIRAFMPGEITDSKHRLYTEMLLYLITRPDRTTNRAQLENALWYGHPAGDGTIRAAMARLRRWLGSRPGTGEWISEGTLPEGTYTAADGILLDWHLMLRLRDRGDHRGHNGAADYRTALQLVRGPAMLDRPDHGRYRRPYTWVDGSDISPVNIMAVVSDVAHRLATDSLHVGDADTARWAVQQGWLADPDRGYDELWIDYMRAEHLDGRTAALHGLIEQFRQDRGAEVLEDLQPRTYKAIHGLLRDSPD